MKFKTILTTLLLNALAITLAAHNAHAAGITRVSVSSEETQSNYSSYKPSTSKDGRYVAFDSNASNLVPNDTIGDYTDVFVRDRQTGTTTLVSVDSNEQPGPGQSFSPSISDNGRYIAFVTQNNFDPSDTNGFNDVYMRDLQEGTTTWVSVNPGNSDEGEDAGLPSISGDGRYVAFESRPENLLTPIYPISQIYVRDLQNNSTTLVSKASDGTPGDRDSRDANLSANGQFIAFSSSAHNLVANDTNDEEDVFIYELATGNIRRASVSSSGAQQSASSSRPALSADGRYVTFGSDSDTLVSGDTNGRHDVFLSDLQTGQTTRISVPLNANYEFYGASNPDISDDGRYVIFWGLLSPTPANQSNIPQVYVRDRKLNTTRVVSLNLEGKLSNGSPGIGSGQFSAISGNGRYIAFTSNASDLVARDTNGVLDVFVSDRNGIGYTIPLSISDVSVKEGTSDADGPPSTAIANFVVTLDSPSDTAVSVNYTTVNSTATAAEDFSHRTGILTFNPRETRKVISVPLHSDVLDEVDEIFRVNLYAPSGAEISDRQAVGTIIDDDSAPALFINDISVAEGNAGTVTATFTVRLSAPSGKTISVNAITANGTAKAPGDYTSAGKRLVFAPGGPLTQSFSVTIISDAIVENDEALYVFLSSAANASVGKARGVGTITNDDSSS
jgi:hypothetical protein